MVLKFLLRYLANNEHLIQRIAESYPMRRAARLCISLYYRIKGGVNNERLSDIPRIDPGRLRSFVRNFSDNIKKEIEEAKYKSQQKK